MSMTDEPPEDLKFKIMVAVNKADLLPKEATATRIIVSRTAVYRLPWTVLLPAEDCVYCLLWTVYVVHCEGLTVS